MSKENVITYLAIIPVAIMMFRSKSLMKSLTSIWTALLGTFAFLAIRTAILGFNFGHTPGELMNNPYLKYQDGLLVSFSMQEKFATIFFTLGKYIQLLLFPHPLTADYYPRHIGVMNFTDVTVIISLLLYVFLGILIVWFWKRDKIISFSILYFIITLSIVSNIVFPIGTNMSERFMFMPSVGFCLLMSYLLFKYMGKRRSMSMIFMGAILCLYSFKTITRNVVWKDNFTLYTTDVKVSSNSAKGLNAAGGSLINAAENTKDENQRKEYLNQAIPYLQKAIKIHPQYKNAYLLLGNAHFYLEQYPDAVQQYEKALQVSPGYTEALNNLGFAYRDAGRFFGEKQGDLEKAKRYLTKAFELKPTDYETLRLLGVAYGMGKNHQNAVKYFELAVEQRPQDAQAYLNLANACRNYGDETCARLNFTKVVEIDPSMKDKIQ